jgi:GNAT superfamily N-acetyltransferase
VTTEIRRARFADAAEMARLADELGYPMSSAEATRRLAVLLPNEQHHVAVAARGERPLGLDGLKRAIDVTEGCRRRPWVTRPRNNRCLMSIWHSVVRRIPEGKNNARSVDMKFIRRGFGRKLLAVAESWALARGLSALTVRSNTVRELSHRFYESLGHSRPARL